MSTSQEQPKETVWVVLRYDGAADERYRASAQADGTVPGLSKAVGFGDEGVIEAPMDLLEVSLTVKEVLPDADEAFAEVERLNALARRRGLTTTRYVALPGRWFPEGRHVEVGY